MGSDQTTTLCPACGSGKIANHCTDPDDGYRACSDCGWQGNIRELVVVPIPKNPHSLELDGDAALDVAEQISMNLLRLLAQHASTGIGMAVLEAGICGKRDKKNLARLLRAACTAAHKGILGEADNISKEYSERRILS